MKALDCRAVDERLSDYLDESLPGAEMEGVATHLAACPTCREAAEDLRATLAAIHYEPVPAASPEFWTKLYARVEQEGERIPAPRAAAPAWLQWLRGPRRMPRLVVAGAMAVSLAVGFAIHQQPETPPLVAPVALQQQDDVAEMMSQHAEQSAAYPLSDMPRLTFVNTEINVMKGGQ